MQVLYVIDHLFPGGAGRSLAAMAPYLVSSGCQLEVVYLLDKTGLQDELERAGGRVTRVEGSSRLAWFRNALGLVRNRKPDLVHTTLFEADIVGRIAGFRARVPVVSSLVNLAYGPEQKRDQRLSRWKLEAARFVDARTARTVTRFHALTRNVAEEMGRRLGIPGERIDVVPRGRDPERLGRRMEDRRHEARKRLGIGAGEIVVLAVARHEYQKGLDILLDAFRGILAVTPNARLLVSGRHGGATPMLQQKAAALGSAVNLLGARDDVPELMCAADVFVLPSRWEGLGGVLLEAMALEVPIVATGLSAVREVLDEGRCGWLVPPERPEMLGAAVVSAISDFEEAHQKVSVARARFMADYTIDRVTSQMISMYERAVSQGPRPRSLAGWWSPMGTRGTGASERSASA